MASKRAERQPLLDQRRDNQTIRGCSDDQGDRGHVHETCEVEKVEFDRNDPENPREWSLTVRYLQTLQIFILAFVSPMASSALAPATDDISSEFGVTKQVVLLAQTGFVCMLGTGPLFLAPMSEAFGRRPVFLVNLALFTIIQIPTALAPNVVTLIVLRTLGGFFGSVGVANGGGSISDLFETRERAPVLGVYLLAPLLGPTVGPLMGGIIVDHLGFRWIIWIVAIASATTTCVCYFCLRETQAKTILQSRKCRLEARNKHVKYVVEGVTDQSILSKIGSNSTRAIRILRTQPIVMTMSFYQALVFSSMYSLYAQYSTIFSSDPYFFNQTQVGLAYLGPATGFVATAVPIVLYIDRVYNYLVEANAQKQHGDEDDFSSRTGESPEGQPEYRLPLATIGAILLPVSLFWFGWTVEAGCWWPVPIAATLFFGASQVSIFNTVQTYYIDAYEANAASALAAGAFLRSVCGGIVPLFVGALFERLGYGWGMSIFGMLSVILLPAPIVFYMFGKQLREKFPFEG